MEQNGGDGGTDQYHVEDDVQQPVEEIGEGLSTELLAYLYPLDGTDYESGWNAFEAPIQRAHWRDLGVCLKEEGYLAVGEDLMLASAVYPSEIWRFPRIGHLREFGFFPSYKPSAIDLSGFVGSPVHSIRDPLVEHLAERPEYEIAPTVAAANDFQDVFLDRCVPNLTKFPAFGSAMELKLQWFRIVDAVTDGPDLREARIELFGCIGDSMGGGQAIEDRLSAIATIDSVMFSTEGEALLQASQQYAQCMEPFIEARRPILAAERERLVQDKFGTLLAMEELFDSLLAE